MSPALIQTEPAPVSKVAGDPPLSAVAWGSTLRATAVVTACSGAQLNGMTIDSGPSLYEPKSSRFLTSWPVIWALGCECFHCETHSLIQQPARI
jgi:hypothetical protein